MSICDAPAQVNATSSKLDLPEGVPALRAFYLYMSNTCNLRCRHCWITPGFGDGKETPGDFVDPEALRQAIVESKPLGLCSVKLTGGEPTLHPRFMEIADMLTAEGMNMDMETNGTLMTAEMARHLKEKTKVTFVSVSLDAPDARSHDNFRGMPGAFDAALRGLNYLVGAGYKNCQVIMSVHNGNRHQVEEVVALAKAHGASSVKFNPVSRTGRGIAMEESGEVMDFDEHLAFAQYVSTELRRKAGIAVILNMPPALTSMRDLLRTQGRTGDCGVLRILGILGNGDIALCGIGRTVPELVYGKLGRDSIRDIWFTNPTILGLRRALADVDALPNPCAKCLFVRTCRTGCVANNYSESGSLIAPTWLCAEADRRGVFPSKRAQRRSSGGEKKN